jgi:hypothetical protein
VRNLRVNDLRTTAVAGALRAVQQKLDEITANGSMIARP